jgi:hypothetical protein
LILNQEGDHTITLKGHQITERVRPDGFVELERHHRVLLRLRGLSFASCGGFMPGEAILDGVTFAPHETGIWLELSDTYGLSGMLAAREVELEFEPTNENFGASHEPRQP